MKVVYQSDTIINHEIIEKFRIPISQAEMNIIKVIDFDFNKLNPPYKILQDLDIQSKDKDVYALCRIILLDMAKCGAFLFYKPMDINAAAIVLATSLLRGEMLLDQKQ